MIVWVSVVKTVLDSDSHFGNVCDSHLQSQSELYHISGWHLTLVIDLTGQLSCGVIVIDGLSVI